MQSGWKNSQACLILLLKSLQLGLEDATPMPKLCPEYLTLHRKTYFCTVVHYLCIAHHQKTNIICRHLLQQPEASFQML